MRFVRWFEFKAWIAPRFKLSYGDPGQLNVFFLSASDKKKRERYFPKRDANLEPIKEACQSLGRDYMYGMDNG